MAQIIKDIVELAVQPNAVVDLMLESAKDNDPFFAEVTRKHYDESRKRHRKMPLFRRFCSGVAACFLPSDFDAYFQRIDAAARRNFKKSERNGYVFRKIDWNCFHTDIQQILGSTNVRQGRSFMACDVQACTNPNSATAVHDYVYFGVLKEGRLLAYAGCLISGEMCSIESIYGHDAYKSDGIVPMLIIEIARFLYKNHPAVRFYIYGSYFGASESMRRFKRKFCFVPHRVEWLLNGKSVNVMDAASDVNLRVPAGLRYQLVFRKVVNEAVQEDRVDDVEFIFCRGILDALRNRQYLRQAFGPTGCLKATAKLASSRRFLYLVIQAGKVLHFGWMTTSFCRFYKVGTGDVVIGPIWSADAARGRGIATFAVQKAINRMRAQGHKVFFIDTSNDNAPCLRVIDKQGFGPPIASYIR